MSIYPVKLSEWFPPGDENHDSMKMMVRVGGDSNIGCASCGKRKIRWQTAWGHHSLPWGYGDVWCTRKCFERRRDVQDKD